MIVASAFTLYTLIGLFISALTIDGFARDRNYASLSGVSHVFFSLVSLVALWPLVVAAAVVELLWERRS